jgi:hypothetical protein
MLCNGDSLGKFFEKPSKWVPTRERGKIKYGHGNLVLM